MHITSTLLHLTETLAVCAVTLRAENGEVTLYATALASESALYPDLAQERAIALAYQVLSNGIESVVLEGVLTEAEGLPSSLPLTGPVTESVAPPLQSSEPPTALELAAEPQPIVPLPSPEITEDPPPLVPEAAKGSPASSMEPVTASAEAMPLVSEAGAESSDPEPPAPEEPAAPQIESPETDTAETPEVESPSDVMNIPW